MQLSSILFFSVALATAAVAQSPQSATPADPLKACQEQLADVRGAVKEIILPNAAFQAETLFTLNRRLGEAIQQHAQDVASIDALRKELGALRQPSPETPASSTGTPAHP